MSDRHRPERLQLGIDLGGTKIEVAVLDPAGGFRLRRRVPTPRDDYAATVRTIAALVLDAEREVHAACSVGVGIPGAVSPASGLIKNANSTWLNGRPLHQDLETTLARPVRIQNDANCLAVSEAADGAAAGAALVFAAILGTGVGAGLCWHGSPWTGRQAIAGEWGHNPLPSASPPDPAESPGPRCWCGRDGCIEAWLSGPALAADAGAADGLTDARRQHESRPGDAGAVAARAAAGDPIAIAAIDRYVDRLARALGAVINLIDPDVVVLGGGVSNLAVLYRELPGRLPSSVFSDIVDTPIRPALHGDSSGVRGAAWLWPAATAPGARGD